MRSIEFSLTLLSGHRLILPFDRITKRIGDVPIHVTLFEVLGQALSLFDFPFVWLLLFPGVEEPPAFVIYSGIVLGIVGFVAAVGLWLQKTWSYGATIVVCVLNFLLGAPGVMMGPTVAVKITVGVTEVVAVLILVLVFFRGRGGL